MLAGCVDWSADETRRWTAAGYRSGRVADLVDVAARRPTIMAVVDGERQLTYAQLRSRIDHLALALHRAGFLNLLDRVVLQLPNALEFVVTFLALVRLGAIPVMALRAHPLQREVRHFHRRPGAAAYFVPGAIHGFDLLHAGPGGAARLPACARSSCSTTRCRSRPRCALIDEPHPR